VRAKPFLQEVERRAVRGEHERPEVSLSSRWTMPAWGHGRRSGAQVLGARLQSVSFSAPRSGPSGGPRACRR
jgi:hypothetical protein